MKNKKFQVRYKSVMQGTMALYHESDSHGECVQKARELKANFKAHSLPEEAKSVEVTGGK